MVSSLSFPKLSSFLHHAALYWILMSLHLQRRPARTIAGEQRSLKNGFRRVLWSAPRYVWLLCRSNRSGGIRRKSDRGWHPWVSSRGRGVSYGGRDQLQMKVRAFIPQTVSSSNNTFALLIFSFLLRLHPWRRPPACLSLRLKLLHAGEHSFTHRLCGRDSCHGHIPYRGNETKLYWVSDDDGTGCTVKTQGFTSCFHDLLERNQCVAVRFQK